jgi:hypothetical protein
MAHNPEVAGSNPAPATIFRRSRPFPIRERAFAFSVAVAKHVAATGVRAVWRRDGGDGAARDETAWTWQTLPPAVAGCRAQRSEGASLISLLSFDGSAGIGGRGVACQVRWAGMERDGVDVPTCDLWSHGAEASPVHQRSVLARPCALPTSSADSRRAGRSGIDWIGALGFAVTISRTCTSPVGPTRRTSRRVRSALSRNAVRVCWPSTADAVPGYCAPVAVVRWLRQRRRREVGREE